jgi:hypothetical protein
MEHCRNPRRRGPSQRPEEPLRVEEQPAFEQPLQVNADPLEQLRFIRQTMESAGAFTAVPGYGTMALGLTALAASWLASIQPTPERWLGVWFAEAAIAIGIASVAMMHKAERAKQSLVSGPAKKFGLSFAPPILVGGLLTLVFYQARIVDRVPALWLLLYGTAVVTGGAFSVRIVPVMGLCFLGLGGLTVISPAAWGNWAMAIGFGLVHMVFGAIIARRHGG